MILVGKQSDEEVRVVLEWMILELVKFARLGIGSNLSLGEHNN